MADGTISEQEDALETDLTALHQNIRDQIAQQFPQFKIVEFYRDDEDEEIPLPACLLEMDEFEISKDNLGTEQIELALRFSARLIFNREYSKNAPLLARMAAVYLSNFINQNRFSVNIGPAKIINAMKDEFHPALDARFETWRLEWLMPEAIFGKNIWADFKRVEEIYLNDYLIYQREKNA